MASTIVLLRWSIVFVFLNITRKLDHVILILIVHWVVAGCSFISRCVTAPMHQIRAVLLQLIGLCRVQPAAPPLLWALAAAGPSLPLSSVSIISSLVHRYAYIHRFITVLLICRQGVSIFYIFVALDIQVDHYEVPFLKPVWSDKISWII